MLEVARTDSLVHAVILLARPIRCLGAMPCSTVHTMTELCAFCVPRMKRPAPMTGACMIADSSPWEDSV